MDPIQMALEGGGVLTDLIGAGMNYNAQKQQQRNQENDRTQQLYLQDQAVGLAKQLQRQGLATQVDANGNVSYYDQATNSWRVALSPTGQQQQDIANRGTVQQGQAATDAFAQAVTNSKRQAQEGQVAGSELSQLKDAVAGRNAVTPDQLAANSRMASRETVNTGMQPVASGLLSEAIRSGQGGIDGITQALAKARTQAAAGMTYNPNDAITGAQDINSKRVGDFIQNYGAMANRSGQIQGSGTVTGPADNLTAALQKLRGQADADTANANTGIVRGSGIGVQANGMNTLNNADAQLMQGIGNTLQSNSSGISSFISKLMGSKSGNGFSFGNSADSGNMMFG